MILRLAVLVQHLSVTNGQTDKQTDTYDDSIYLASIASLGNDTPAKRRRGKSHMALPQEQRAAAVITSFSATAGATCCHGNTDVITSLLGIGLS